MQKDDNEDPEVGNVTFPNGDKYQGQWKDNSPNGYGIYSWSNGTSYEGYWKYGLLNGKGKYMWAQGASFQGEWQQGYMHGNGIYHSPHGYQYTGGFYKDLRHGLGKKSYSNGDYYEGVYKLGKRNGPGRYYWSDGNSFDGEWKNNKFHGRGTFLWANNERYDGEWKDGNEDGMGVFTNSDGTFEGFWKKGRRNGVGIYYPQIKSKPSTKQRGAKQNENNNNNNNNKNVFEDNQDPQQKQQADKQQHSSLTESLVKEFTQQSKKQNASTKMHKLQDLKYSVKQKQDIRSEQSEMAPRGMDKKSSANVPHKRSLKRRQAKKVPSLGAVREKPDENMAYIREYNMAQLVREQAVQHDVAIKILGEPHSNPFEIQTNQFKFSRQKPQQSQMGGEFLYKGHPSYDLLLNLQHGIRWSITKFEEPYPISHLQPYQFIETYTTKFDHDGTDKLHPHPTQDFVWKDYAPQAFRKLRNTQDISAGDYMLSLCGNRSLMEIQSAAKAGSKFYVSRDRKYFIKTISKSESKYLLEILPEYCKHLESNHNSLLVKFYGMHKIGSKRGQSIRFLVMSNVFQSDTIIDKRYDLKGIGGRSAHNTDTQAKTNQYIIYKDSDLDQKFQMVDDWYTKLKEYIKTDCQFLQSLNLTDYSFLVGVHNMNENIKYGQKQEDGKEQSKQQKNDSPPPQNQPEIDVNDDNQSTVFSQVPATSVPSSHTQQVDPSSVTKEEAYYAKLYGPDILPEIKKLNERSKEQLTVIKNMCQQENLEQQVMRDLLLIVIKKIVYRQTQKAQSGNDQNEEQINKAAIRVGLSQQQQRLGQATQAVVKSQQNGNGQGNQSVILYFGIIDVMQNYNNKKMVEGFYRTMIGGKNKVTAVNPRKYAQKFQTYILNQVFTN